MTVRQADQRIDARSLQIDARQLARKLLDQARDLQAAARTMRDDAREVLISVGMSEAQIKEILANSDEDDLSANGQLLQRRQRLLSDEAQ